MLPLSLITSATTLYYLMINNIPFLKELFPKFYTFILLMGVVIIFSFGFIGYHTMKGWLKWLYDAEMEAPAEANIYSYQIRPGISKITQPYAALNSKLLFQLYKKFDLTTPEIDKELEEYVNILYFIAKGGDVRELEVNNPERKEAHV